MFGVEKIDDALAKIAWQERTIKELSKRVDTLARQVEYTPLIGTKVFGWSEDVGAWRHYTVGPIVGTLYKIWDDCFVIKGVDGYQHSVVHINDKIDDLCQQERGER